LRIHIGARGSDAIEKHAQQAASEKTDLVHEKPPEEVGRAVLCQRSRDLVLETLSPITVYVTVYECRENE
jgi:hypothetical protein